MMRLRQAGAAVKLLSGRRCSAVAPPLLLQCAKLSVGSAAAALGKYDRCLAAAVTLKAGNVLPDSHQLWLPRSVPLLTAWQLDGCNRWQQRHAHGGPSAPTRATQDSSAADGPAATAASSSPSSSATAATAAAATAAPDSATATSPAEPVSYGELAAAVYRATEEVLGPLSVADLIFGLQAVARRHRSDGLSYAISGVPRGGERELILSLLAAADLSYAAYKANAAAAAAVSHLRLHCMRRYVATPTRLRPAYFIAVDHDARSIIWAIRGTKSVADVVTDISGASTPFDGGRVHWGVLHASKALLREELPHLASLTAQFPTYGLLVTGHSLGGGVAALTAYMINTRPALRKQLRHCPQVTAVAVAPPCVMSEGLAAACEQFTTSLVYGADPVPRLSPKALAALRSELLAEDWAQQLRAALLEAEYTQAIGAAVASASAGTAQAAAQLQQLASELLASRHLSELGAALSQAVYGSSSSDSAAAAAVAPDGAGANSAAAAVPEDDEEAEEGDDEATAQALLQARWTRQVEAWQQQQQQQQAAVIRSWVSDVSERLLPYVTASPLRDTDIRRVADAAVASLTSSLGSVSSSLGGLGAVGSSLGAVGSSLGAVGSSLGAVGSSLGAVGSSLGAWTGIAVNQGSSGAGTADGQPTAAGGAGAAGKASSGASSGISSNSSNSSGSFLAQPQQQQQRDRVGSDSRELSSSSSSSSLEQQQPTDGWAASWTAAAGHMLAVVSSPLQLLVSSGSISSGGISSGGSSSSSSSTFGLGTVGVAGQQTADSVLAYWNRWSVSQEQQQQQQQQRDERSLLAGTGSGVQDTAAAAAVAAADLHSARGSIPATAAAGTTTDTSAAADPVNMYPPGRLLFLLPRDMLAHGNSILAQQPDWVDAHKAEAGRAAGDASESLSIQLAAGEADDAVDDADTEPQRHTNGWPNDHGCSTSVHNAAAVKETHGCARRDAQAGSSSGSSGSSSIIATPAASGAQHELLQAPRSGNFDRLVLHPSMFTHHRTRSYRGALLELLRAANQASGL